MRKSNLKKVQARFGEKLFKALINEFLGEVDDLICSIQKAQTSGDLVLLERSAHRLVSIGGFLGPSQLTQMGKLVQTYAMEENRKEIAKILPPMISSIQSLKTKLSREKELFGQGSTPEQKN